MEYQRKDRKGRNLYTGEYQKKDGRYAFKYRNPDGEYRYVYSWRLTKTDATPPSKRESLPLREKIEQIRRDLSDGIYPGEGELTVSQLIACYIDQKKGVRRKTAENYAYVQRLLEKDVFGGKRISEIRLSDAKAFLIRLQTQRRYRYNSVRVIRAVLKSAFHMAVEDDRIRKNPFDFVLSEVLTDCRGVREAIDAEQEKTLLLFLETDRYSRSYRNGILLLLRTGIRVSELAGLTVRDLDMEQGLLYIRRQLLRDIHGNYFIESPKSNCGSRAIPMTKEVRALCRRILAEREVSVKETCIDGVSGFLFLDRDGNPCTARHWQGRIARLCSRYNREHTDSPLHITPHMFRHTYCTRMAMHGMNPKILQYLMGHADISLTLGTYTHVDLAAACAEVARLEKVH